MKRKMRVIAAAAMAAVMIAMTGCGSSGEAEETTAETTGDGTYTVGIIQQLEHAALDEATKGFQDTLTEKLGDKVTFDYQNAQNEQANCATIATKFVSNNVDLIMANATTAVQCAKEATTEIPVVGTSVTDYVSTGIVDSAENPGSNVTGYSDLSDANNHVELIQQLLPEAQTVAILYSTGEENSRIQAESAVAAFEAAGLTAESYTANDSNDISSVVTEACTQADVIYVPTDNLMAANMELVKNVALNQKVPVVSCFTADENDGALLSISISYYTMGYLAGEMAYEILVNGADPASMPIGVMSVEDMDITINQSVADELGITIPESMQQYVK